MIYAIFTVMLVDNVWLMIVLLILGLPLMSITKTVHAPDRIWKNPYYRFN